MSALRKGWCPSAERPMETGDGWLVRIHMQNEALTAKNARAIAACAARYGNGHIDLTSRGNLQIRGVTPETYDALFEELLSLGLAGKDRPPSQQSPENLPLPGFKDNGTVALGLPFGRIESPMLAWLADAAEHFGDAHIGLSPWRIMFLRGIAAADAEHILAQAKKAGFIIDATDARRNIQCCPGAPACASAEAPTRALALAIAGALPGLNHSVHVSGCAKGCACSVKTDATIIARNGAYDLAWNATAGDAPSVSSLSPEAIIDALMTWESCA